MATENIESAPIEWVKIDYLYCDESYQRPLNMPWCERTALVFDPDAFGTLTVSEKAGDRYMTLDGRHRAELLRILGWNGQKVPCHVHRGLSQAQEAELFAKLNNARQLTFLDRFFSRLVAKEQVACAVAKVTSDAGYRIDRGSRDGSITAVNALQDVYLGRGQRIRGENPDALKNTLHVLTEAWGRERATVGKNMIAGVGAFFLRYGNAVDHDRLIKKLANITSGPQGLINRGAGKQEMHGGSIITGIAHYLTEQYNQGLRGKKRLTGWRETEHVVA